MDFAGPFMGENFLIVVDSYSKWPEVYRMTLVTAEKTVEALREMFASHGVPAEIVSDNGRQFTADEFQEFTKANNIRHIFSAPYHPSTNGEAERFVRTFKTAMKVRRGERGSWNLRICEFLLSYHTTPHSTTRRTPAELMAGRNLKTRLDAVHPEMGQRIQRQSAPTRQTKQVEVGEPVLVRDYRHRKETWVAGVVLKRFSPGGRFMLEKAYRPGSPGRWITPGSGTG